MVSHDGALRVHAAPADRREPVWLRRHDAITLVLATARTQRPGIARLHAYAAGRSGSHTAWCARVAKRDRLGRGAADRASRALGASESVKRSQRLRHNHVMRILNSMKLHSNNADAGLILELVDGTNDGTVCFILKVGPSNDKGTAIDAATARAVMEMSARTQSEPWPVRERSPVKGA